MSIQPNKLLILLLGILLMACGATTIEPTDGTTLYVGAEQVDCTGVAPQMCLLVREDPNAEYTFLYDEIAGFEWEAGYEYELRVNVTEVEDPAPDASSLSYELIEVVSKTAVDG